MIRIKSEFGISKFWHAVVFHIFLLCFGFDHSFSQTIFWKDSLSNVTVFLHIEEKDFKDHQHRVSSAYNVIESKLEFHPQILKIVNKSLRKYPLHVANKNFEQIYIYDQFDKHNAIAGNYIGRHGFFFAVPYTQNGQIDTLDFERLLHHEFSHRLLIFNYKGFDYKAWKKNNGLKYGSIKSYDRTFDSQLYSKGFINKYAVMNKWEDFAAFAENIFIYKPVFWNAVETHEPLRNKFEIISSYYESLDPSMNRDFFLNLNGVSLSRDQE